MAVRIFLAALLVTSISQVSIAKEPSRDALIAEMAQTTGLQDIVRAEQQATEKGLAEQIDGAMANLRGVGL